MGKYKRISDVIEVEQYFHNKPCKGAKVRNPEIIYSLDGKLFYVTNCDRATDWLSVEKNEDGKYISYPFALYEVKVGKIESIENNIKLVNLYIDLFDLKYPEPYAWVETIHDKKVEVKEGDYIIPELDGIHFYPLKPDVFEKTYKKFE